MATKLQASQISYNSTSNSWYKRLYALQNKFKVTKDATTTITPGTKATYSDMNAFINKLNALQSNTYGSYGNWSSYKPSVVTQYNKITQASTMTKIDNMLASLESFNVNNYTSSDSTKNTQETLNEYTVDNETTNDGTYDCSTNYTVADATETTDGTDIDAGGDVTYSTDSTDDVDIGNGTEFCPVENTYATCGQTYVDCSNCETQQTMGDGTNYTNSTDSTSQDHTETTWTTDSTCQTDSTNATNSVYGNYGVT